MRFHFHDRMTSERLNSLEMRPGFERRQRKQIVNKPVSSIQNAIYSLAIKPIRRAFFSRVKGKVSADYNAWRQQSTKQHVGTKMHVVMSVNSLRIGSIEAAILLYLSRHDIFKGAHQAGMENH